MSSPLALVLGIVIAVTAALPSAASAEEFGISAVDGQITDQNGNAYTQAGGHPAAISVQVVLNHHLDTDHLDLFSTTGLVGGR